MSRRIVLLLLFLASPFAIHSAPVSPVLPDKADGQITINNRLLARVNDKTITVLDVVKKMDLFLSAYYPEAMKLTSSRYQFYMSNWKAVLERMIDDQLILADSEGKDFKITEGEIRQAILDRLGPNVMASLDKLNMNYEEARKMIHEELIVQKMMGAKVHSKAFQSVGPSQVKTAYKDYIAEQATGQEWEYQVVSIRSPNVILSEQLAAHAYILLSAAKSGPEALAAKLQEIRKPEDPEFAVNVSQILKANEKTISEAHRKGLQGLEPGMYSKPIAQVSGIDKVTVQRIFFLKDLGNKEPPSFDEIANKLRENLMEVAATQAERIYKTKLRQRFSFDSLHLEEIPSDFQPFILGYKS